MRDHLCIFPSSFQSPFQSVISGPRSLLLLASLKCLCLVSFFFELLVTWMNPPDSAACLSLAPNLRCGPLNDTQHNVLIIPPAIELVFCMALVILKWRSGRAHLLLAVDGIFYFILALVDLLHVIPTVRNSTTAFKAMDVFVGSMSFVPMLLYTSYLFWMSHREFVINLPPRYQSALTSLLIIFIPMVITTNEVASFVGVFISRLHDSQASLASYFTNNDGSLWLSLSQLSLAFYTTIQSIFFLLAFYRLGETFRDRQRIEITHADEHHYFNGIGWITVGIQLGAIESLVGFAMGGFAVPLSRRILRLIARSCLIIGVLKGMDTSENFEYITNELASWRRSVPFSNFYQHMSRRASRFPYPPQETSKSEKVAKGGVAGQHVTVHYESGHAPFLQIRFSKLNLPEPAIVTGGNGVWSPRQSSLDNFGQTYASRNTSGDISAYLHDTRHFRGNASRGSGCTISDSMSIVRELSQRFPLPPRITGKYRGSILGQRCEDDGDEYPLVGISRESSLRRDIAQGAAAGTGTGTGVRSATGSIKRKPAPPLLHIPQPAYTRAERPALSWGGLDSQHDIEYATQSYAIPMTPGPIVDSPSSANSPSTSQPRVRQRTPRRQLFDRASRAVSVISIRSAEWLSSARSRSATRPPITLANIEAYYNGGVANGPQHTYADHDDGVAYESGEEFIGDDRNKSTDDVAQERTPRSQITKKVSIGHVHTRTTPTPTMARFPLGREPISSTYGEVQSWS